MSPTFETEAVIKILENVGVDTDCNSCMALAFMGSTNYEHTCEGPHLSKPEIERLAKLVEEAGETLQMVGKILRFGYEARHPDGGSTNRQGLMLELSDLNAAVTLLQAAKDIDIPTMLKMLADKLLRKNLYLNHQSAELIQEIRQIGKFMASQ